MSSVRTLLEEILVQTAEDWSDVSWIVGLAHGETSDPARAHQLALEAIVEGLSAGLLVGGDLAEDGFHPWPGDPDSAVLRVRRAWSELDGRDPEPDSIGWFDLTPAGEVRAQEIESREA